MLPVHCAGGTSVESQQVISRFSILLSVTGVDPSDKCILQVATGLTRIFFTVVSLSAIASSAVWNALASPEQSTSMIVSDSYLALEEIYTT